MQQVSGVYASPFLDIDELKRAFRAWKVSEAFDKQAPGARINTPIKKQCCVTIYGGTIMNLLDEVLCSWFDEHHFIFK